MTATGDDLTAYFVVMNTSSSNEAQQRHTHRPGALHIQVVDVLRHRVVTEHGRELLLEVWSESLNQGGTCKKIKAQDLKLFLDALTNKKISFSSRIHFKISEKRALIKNLRTYRVVRLVLDQPEG